MIVKLRKRQKKFNNFKQLQMLINLAKIRDIKIFKPILLSHETIQ